ncbi:Tol-Pal system beta propeller repeat protein TolB [Methylobacterium gnaphalii]|uniref:Tol-Pal system protein TolB n=1 Tax=Methylobacterium gnaphalii TaxID=1010610 RepID=A0A512JEP9_9HYPH|nr:Tol-Pal system beta propeller repeat protein TolB [Methylobacterium gnaphalii]GEP08428.1 protein TolB [Methylobacterium gnaphalii]GJD68859.1 Tol-Pal system protein TolB [Methylobacterium gnaphalii]GLS47383.1 protein TolB [Methylobacterium gnaphalii]
MTTLTFTRRSLAAAFTALGLVLAAAAPAHAQLQLRIGGGAFQPLPIAIVDFAGDPSLGSLMSSVVTNNLRRSGYFTPLEKSRFPEVPSFDAAPNFDKWRGTGVQALVTGRVSRDGGGKLKVEFRLWDVTSGQQVTGQQYGTDPGNARRAGHLISDVVYTKITGIGGFFDSRVAFVDESGPKEHRRKRLMVMDQDGANVRALTSGDLSVVAPRYSPAGQDIAFMTQASGQQPRVQMIDLESGTRQTVGSFESMSTSPRFSPDGRRLVMSVQQGGNADIVTVDIATKAQRPITQGLAIDTSPTYSPDGSQIVFESDRGGSQQIYVMGADGSNPHRISFGEGSASQPAWSPKGDLIAFTRQRKGGFAICVMRPDGSGERVLTEGFHNEGPTFAPNGQYVMFFRDPGGQGGGKLYMVDITGRVENPVPTPSFASDPTWSPLLGGR